MDCSSPEESEDSSSKENMHNKPLQAVQESPDLLKVILSLPDSDSELTDSDEVPSDSQIPIVSTVDEDENENIFENKGATRPVPIPGLVFRDRSHDDIKKATLELLNDSIEEWTIGFELAAFPQTIENWIPSLRVTALPGSYEHLLLLMLDGVKEFNDFQTTLREAGVPGAAEPREDRILTTNPGISRRIATLGGQGRGQAKSIMIPRGQIAQFDQTADEMYFWRELHILRLLVFPLRDETEEITWITSREQQPDDMIQQFDAAKGCIIDFKKRILKALEEGPENKVINLPPPKGLESPSYKELRLRTSSLHQFRMDSCKGSLERAPFSPSEIEMRRRYIHIENRCGHPKEPGQPRFKNFIPPVQVSSNLAFEFDNLDVIKHHGGRILCLLVQIAQWLALARGFAAVHLFCDVARLFSTHGVDLGSKTQVEICKQLTQFRLLSDSLHSPLPLNFPASTSVVGQFSPTFIQSVIQANRKMMNALVELDTLFHPVKKRASTSQILEWQLWGGERVLALRTPRLFFSRATAPLPWPHLGLFSDEELAAHLDAMVT